MSSLTTITTKTTTITHQPIPLPYRLTFIFLDILLPTLGILLNTFSPLTNLANYTPNPTTPIPPETLVLIDCTSGFFATLLMLNVLFLLYRPNDVFVWKALVGAVLLQDLFMVGGFLREINLRGDWAWSGQDYGNVGGYAGIALVRGLFVMGVGMGGGRGGMGAKKEL